MKDRSKQTYNLLNTNNTQPTSKATWMKKLHFEEKCQITSVNSKVACVGDNVDLDWVYENTADILSVTWTYIDSQTSAQTTIMQFVGGSATVSGNYNVLHKTNGGITLTKVTKANSGSYKISVIYATAPTEDDTVAVTVNDCRSECKCKGQKAVIASVVIGIVGAIILPIVVGGTVKEFFGRKLALVVDSIGIVFGVAGSVLGIVVQAIDCCEDSDCCEDECEKNWIETTAIVFIIIGCLVGIVAVVIFYLVWCKFFHLSYLSFPFQNFNS
ncbi:uncharacterized protein LOC132722852 [Ruditapes philippinarum]|uniref:uncharacterized protein LOC132722852 n=1 Tax=Ruditapes philippinarum TaxID=129788 RepID=UPI00295C367D|nr:uncharacterized protein LOC132722852 [Ruditapes philippinarum]